MNYRVILSTRARSDLQRNATWWAEHHDLDQALRWYDGIIEAIDNLDDHPRQYPLAPENDKVEHELRELHFGVGARPTHRAIFTIIENEIRVLTVQHGAQDEPDGRDLEID